MITNPLTPYHLGPGGFLGILLLKWIDFPTLIIASAILDIEPIMVLVFNLSYPLHGVFHSFFGAILVSLVLIVVMKYFREYFSPIMAVFNIEQEIRLRNISFGAFLGTFSHILLDAPIYSEMNPFFPLIGNPFLIASSFSRIYISIFCVYCFLGAILSYFLLLIIKIMKRRKIENKFKR